MADKKISELVNITGSNIADTDEFVVVDSSASETKAITASELRTAIGNGDFTVTGDLTVQGTTITVDSATAQNIVLGDNDKMTFGAGSDLQIYHDGSHSYIRDVGTGLMRLTAQDFLVEGSDGSDIIYGVQGGATTVYHAGASKLATTSTGIDVTGSITADSGYFQGSNSFINDTMTLNFAAPNGQVAVKNSSGSPAANLYFYTTDTSGNTNLRQGISYNGDISFYEDTGTTAKFFWDASAESLGIGTSSPSTPLHISGASDVVSTIESTDRYSHVDFVDSLGSSRITNDGGNLRLRADNANAVASSYLTLETDGSERMRIDSSGNVGIGTSSPASILELSDTAAPVITLDSTDSTGQRGLKFQYNGATYGQIGHDPQTGELRIRSGETGQGGYYIKFDTGGTERMRIDSSGNVGIGTSSPWESLSLPFDAGLSFGSSTYPLTISRSSAGELITTIADGYDSSSARIDFVMRNGHAGQKTALSIAGSGNVGIGTSSPSQGIHLKTASGNSYVKAERTTSSQGEVGFNTDNWYMYQKTNSTDLHFYNTADRMSITSSGSVGIGTSSPSAKLHLKQATDNAFNGIKIERSTTSNQYSVLSSAQGTTYLAGVDLLGAGNNVLSFGNSTNGTTYSEAMRINSSGNVSIGTTVGSNKLVLGGETAQYPEAINVLETGHATSRRAGLKAGGWVFGQDSGGSGTKDFFIYDGNTGQSRLKIATNGELFSYTSDTTAPSTIFGASTGQMLRSENSEFAFGLSNASPYPLYIQGRNNINAARDIALQPSGGNLMVGRTSPQNLNTAVSFEVNDNTVNNVWAHQASTTTGAGTGIFVATTAINSSLDTSGFFYDAATNWSTSFVRKFAVRKDGVIFSTNTSISSLSDRRIKENIVDATDGTDGLDVINGLRVRRFDYKSGYGRDLTNQVGFIAQEVETVLPSIVDRMHDMEYNNDGESLRTLQEGKLVPILVKAIQEQQATITSLESRIAALETQVNS